MFSIHCYCDQDLGESACLLVILQYKIGTSAFILSSVSSLGAYTLVGLLQMVCFLTHFIIDACEHCAVSEERLKSKRANFFHSLYRIKSCKSKSVGTVNHRINKT